MPFARTWMELEIKSVRQRQIPYDGTYTWKLKYDTNEPIYKTETYSQIQRRDLWLPRWKGVGSGEGMGLGVWGLANKLLYTEWINKSYCITQGTIFKIL